jgi:hypothetical protein
VAMYLLGARVVKVRGRDVDRSLAFGPWLVPELEEPRVASRTHELVRPT